LVGAVALAIAIGFDRWHERVMRDLTRAAVAGRMAPRRIELEHAIERRIALLNGLVAQVVMAWGRPDLPETFDRYAALVTSGPDVGVRTLQYIRNGVITHTWPLNGNDAAVGQDLRVDPRAMIRNDFLRAADSTARGPILSGPTPLYQGGTGLIGRMRAPVPGDSVNVVVGIVLDMANILAESDLDDATNVTWLLRSSDSTRIAGATDSVMAAGDPVVLTVRLPDRLWRLEGTPPEGWPAAVPDRTALRLSLLALVGLVSVLGYLAQSRFRSRIETAYLRDRRRSEAQVVSLFELVPDGLAVIEVESDRYVRVNDAYCAICGRSRDDLIGMPVGDTGIWPSASDRSRAVAMVQNGDDIVDYPLAVTRPDGSVRNTIVSSRVIDLDGIPHCLTVLRDVHEQLELERRVVESQRLEAIGRLAGGVAHDFNNLITAIGGYSELTLDDAPADAPYYPYLLEIRRASQRASELTRQLLTFARRQVVLPQRTDLRVLVSDAEPLLTQLVGDTIVITVHLPDAPVPVVIDPAQFEQALVNITINARDAMPHGGPVMITVAVEGEQGTVSVRDVGVGIPPSAIPHLFEPFYTTKEIGRGTGLGLATVYGVVEQAGGSVDVNSVVDSGTTLTIRLPLADAVGPSAGTAVTEPLPMARGVETVIVVDDESQVRDICLRMLGRLGYRVYAAADGAAAIALLTTMPAVDLVITDLVMPGVGGLELRQWLGGRPESPKVILMSGYNEELATAGADGTPFLAKPFTAHELATLVRGTLDRAPRPVSP
jgi:PAS domain S-box-containing protein